VLTDADLGADSALMQTAYDAIDSSAYLASKCATVRLEIDQAVWGTKVMTGKLNNYGVPIVERPKVKAIKKMDLSGDSGKQIVYS
jgi:hypothetical protein